MREFNARVLAVYSGAFKTNDPTHMLNGVMTLANERVLPFANEVLEVVWANRMGAPDMAVMLNDAIAEVDIYGAGLDATIYDGNTSVSVRMHTGRLEAVRAALTYVLGSALVAYA